MPSAQATSEVQTPMQRITAGLESAFVTEFPNSAYNLEAHKGEVDSGDTRLWDYWEWLVHQLERDEVDIDKVLANRQARNAIVASNRTVSANLVTPENAPDHRVVGHHFGAYCYQEKGTAVYYCDSYDPRQGFWMTNINDASDRRNVAEHAIGRNFHEAKDRGAHWYVSEWNTKVPNTLPCKAHSEPAAKNDSIQASIERPTGG